MRALLTIAMVLMANSVNANWRFERLRQVLDSGKQVILNTASEQVHQIMSTAIQEEVDWQLYRNWKLKLPASQKDTIKALALRDTASWVQATKGYFSEDFERTATKVISDIMTPYTTKWTKSQPSDDELNQDT